MFVEDLINKRGRVRIIVGIIKKQIQVYVFLRNGTF